MEKHKAITKCLPLETKICHFPISGIRYHGRRIPSSKSMTFCFLTSSICIIVCYIQKIIKRAGTPIYNFDFQIFRKQMIKRSVKLTKNSYDNIIFITFVQISSYNSQLISRLTDPLSDCSRLCISCTICLRINAQLSVSRVLY